MRWVCTQEESNYMRARQRQNRRQSSAAETWMQEKLDETGYKWTRQAMWGYRLFDFWCDELGVAVEVDGPEHDAAYDAYRDRYNWCRSAILVIRVKNFDESDASDALTKIHAAETWDERRARVKPGKQLVLANGMKMARSAKHKLEDKC